MKGEELATDDINGFIDNFVLQTHTMPLVAPYDHRT